MSSLHAVHDDDILQYLESLGLLRKVEQGKIRCKFCGDPLTVDSIHALFPEDGHVHLVCAKPSCILKFYRHIQTQAD